MPTYGADKRRDMARSVLPSRAAKNARVGKRSVHHEVRMRIRGLIAKGDWDNEADLALDAQRHKPYQGIKVVVRDRRGADNLSPIMRWAEANADKMGATPQERYAKMRSMLPPNIIGWHAMTHIDGLDEYDANPRYWWRTGYFERLEAEAARRERMRGIVFNVLAVGGKASLDIAIRRSVDRDHLVERRDDGHWNAFTRRWEYREWMVPCSWCHAPRLCAGRDDVEAFLDAVIRSGHAEAVEAIEGLG